MTEIEEPSTGEDTMKPVPLSSTSTAPKTPVPIKLSATKPNGATSNTDEMDLKSYITHVSLWRQPLLTAKYLAFFVILFYSTCEGGYSTPSFLLTALVYRTLLVSTPLLAAEHLKPQHGSVATALSKVGTLVGDQLPLPTPKDITFFVTGLSDVVETKLLSAFKALKQSETELRMLKVVFTHIFTALFILWLFSLRTLFFVTVFWLLLWPVVYSKFHEAIDKACELGLEKTKPAMDKMTELGKDLSQKVLNTANETIDTVKAKYEEFRKKSAKNTTASAVSPAEKTKAKKTA